MKNTNLYANGLYKAWGIGKKGEDKGVLIFFTLKERKIRIETGYGVEGILPDGLVGEILDKYFCRNLRRAIMAKAFITRCMPAPLTSPKMPMFS